MSPNLKLLQLFLGCLLFQNKDKSSIHFQLLNPQTWLGVGFHTPRLKYIVSEFE